MSQNLLHVGEPVSLTVSVLQIRSFKPSPVDGLTIYLSACASRSWRIVEPPCQQAPLYVAAAVRIVSAHRHPAIHEVLAIESALDTDMQGEHSR